MLRLFPAVALVVAVAWCWTGCSSHDRWQYTYKKRYPIMSVDRKAPAPPLSPEVITPGASSPAAQPPLPTP